MTSYRTECIPTFLFHTKEVANYDSTQQIFTIIMWGIIKKQKVKTLSNYGVKTIFPIASYIILPMRCLRNLQWRWKRIPVLIKQCKRASKFFGFGQMGYGCFTSSNHEKDRLINYIKAKKHHKKESFWAKNIEGLLIEKWNWGWWSVFF